MVFRRASFLFLVPGTKLWTQDPTFCLESKIWLRKTRPGRCFEQIRGPEKHGFAWERFPNLRILWDFPRPEWIVWYLGGIWVRWFPPKPSQKLSLPHFQVFAKFGVPPGPPMDPLWALCGPSRIFVLYLYWSGA